jgi:hypothetical protein
MANSKQDHQTESADEAALQRRTGAKRPYHAPALRLVGDVKHLTAGGGGSFLDNNGTQKMN